jgi:RecJ-like exonuclease
LSVNAKEATMANKDQTSQGADATSQNSMKTSADMLHPGDEAAPGTPGTGEDVCPECQGKGRIDGAPCPNCGGSGKIIRAVGGA